MKTEKPLRVKPTRPSGSGWTQGAPSRGQADASIAKGQKEINAFLAGLSNSAREALISHAENTESVYEIWLYATIFGYQGEFQSLENWVRLSFPKLNRRSLLQAEIVRLESDLDQIRSCVDDGLMSLQDAAPRIASLSKELRGHIAEVDRISKHIDRRGLVLAGADRVIRILSDTFHGNEEMMEALEEGFAVAWAQMSEER